jgi:6-phospho-3-hexuloisomerase
MLMKNDKNKKMVITGVTHTEENYNRFDIFTRQLIEQVESIGICIDKSEILKFCEYLLSSEKIVVVGSGRSGLVGKSFSMRLVHLGLYSYLDTSHNCPAITNRDTILAISGSGETHSVIHTVQKAKDVGARILSITNTYDCALNDLSDHPFILPKSVNNELYFPLGTLFELSAYIFLDGLFTELKAIVKCCEKNLRDRHNNLE